VVGEWAWLNDEDEWEPYPKEISNRIENAFVNKTDDFVEVDEFHMIDLRHMLQLQRRNDDKVKNRYVKRSIPQNVSD